MAKKYDFGLVGLGVMGRNFILNVADNNFSAIGLDRDVEKVEALKQEGDVEKVTGTTDAQEFIESLATPRKIMLLVPAGDPVDAVIETLLPHLDQGDLIIDGGNSFYADTDRREAYLAEKGFHFMGTGVSGGAKGARFGPSIMPGGNQDAYANIKPIFEAVAAKVNGEPCVTYLGPKSAGNYVKMVHNGIEYAIMQLIAETYDVLVKGLGLSNAQLHEVFKTWNEGRLQSFLVEITTEIFLKEDELSSGQLVDKILDKAKQKGTGKWTSQNAMDLGIAIPTIDAAVSMRGISAQKAQRTAAEALFGKPAIEQAANQATFIEQAESALYFGFIMAYAQGFTLLAEASQSYGYQLDFAEIAKIWRGGCIIRARMLENIMQAFGKDSQLANLIMDEWFAEQLKTAQQPARDLLSFAFQNRVPVMGLASAVSFFDAFISGRLPLNLVQAQRDHFGAHTYERLDRDGIFHSEWSK